MGIGHAIQGRWSEKGYIFTIGDLASTSVLMYGFFDQVIGCFESACTESREDRNFRLMAVGLVGLLVFRTWETIDAFAAPAAHNRKLRALHMRLGMRPGYALAPYAARPQDGGTVGGLTLRF